MNSTDSHRLLILVFVFSTIFIEAARSETVIFIDSPNRSFLRSTSASFHSDDTLSVSDVSAAVSVLLGLAPSNEISAQSAENLNDIIAPNPFNRPRNVFLLEVTGVAENLFLSRVGSSLNRKINFAKNAATLRLPGREEAILVHLDELLSDDGWTDKHIADLALLIGGAYISDPVESLNGKLIFPMDDAAEIKLHMSQVADREFTLSLVKLMHNVKKAIKMHLEANRDGPNPAELLMGSFDGLKGLKEKYSAESPVHQRMELFVSTSVRLFDLVMDAYKGQIVGVVLVKEKPSTDLVSMFEVTSESPSTRWLAEKETAVDPISIARVLLVRRTLAWITGIILLIATLLGIYFLMNMPLTRDTLLYSNVKLD